MMSLTEYLTLHSDTENLDSVDLRGEADCGSDCDCEDCVDYSNHSHHSHCSGCQHCHESADVEAVPDRPRFGSLRGLRARDSRDRSAGGSVSVGGTRNSRSTHSTTSTTVWANNPPSQLRRAAKDRRQRICSCPPDSEAVREAIQGCSAVLATYIAAIIAFIFGIFDAVLRPFADAAANCCECVNTVVPLFLEDLLTVWEIFRFVRQRRKRRRKPSNRGGCSSSNKSSTRVPGTRSQCSSTRSQRSRRRRTFGHKESEQDIEEGEAQGPERTHQDGSLDVEWTSSMRNHATSPPRGRGGCDAATVRSVPNKRSTRFIDDLPPRKNGGGKNGGGGLIEAATARSVTARNDTDGYEEYEEYEEAATVRSVPSKRAPRFRGDKLPPVTRNDDGYDAATVHSVPTRSSRAAGCDDTVHSAPKRVEKTPVHQPKHMQRQTKQGRTHPPVPPPPPFPSRQTKQQKPATILRSTGKDSHKNRQREYEEDQSHRRGDDSPSSLYYTTSVSLSKTGLALASSETQHDPHSFDAYRSPRKPRRHVLS